MTDRLGRRTDRLGRPTDRLGRRTDRLGRRTDRLGRRTDSLGTVDAAMPEVEEAGLTPLATAVYNKIVSNSEDLMAEVKQGSVTAIVSDEITVPERAGTLNPQEVRRLPKARKGVGLVAMQTAEALRNVGSRVIVQGATPDDIATAGRMADAIDEPVNDAQYVAMVLAQANLLLDAEAHVLLRKALTAVRAAEKFDPRIVDLFPGLIDYFANSKPDEDGTPQPA